MIPYRVSATVLPTGVVNTMRKAMTVASAILFTLAVAAIALHAQQDKSKRPSPPAIAKCDLPGGGSITVDYSSPRVKERKTFWRYCALRRAVAHRCQRSYNIRNHCRRDGGWKACSGRE